MTRIRKKQELHSPTLTSIIMVEKAIEKYENIGTYQLWTKLPKKMMYQTLKVILKYLEQNGKINLVGSRIGLIKKPQESEKIGQKPTVNEIPNYVC